MTRALVSTNKNERRRHRLEEQMNKHTAGDSERDWIEQRVYEKEKHQ